MRLNTKRLDYADNFLSAAEQCTGDWIAFCDQDDVWDFEKLHVLEEAALSAKGSARLIIHNVEAVNENLRPLGYRFPGIPDLKIIRGYDIRIRKLWYGM